MRQTVYLGKEQLIRLAGIAATSERETIGVSQEMNVAGYPISPACLATAVRNGKQQAEIVTLLGTTQELG